MNRLEEFGLDEFGFNFIPLPNADFHESLELQKEFLMHLMGIAHKKEIEEEVDWMKEGF